MAFLAGERAGLAAVAAAKVDDHAPGMLGFCSLRLGCRLGVLLVADHGQGAAGRCDPHGGQEVAPAEDLADLLGDFRT
jgi:hypothetical protein